MPPITEPLSPFLLALITSTSVTLSFGSWLALYVSHKRSETGNSLDLVKGVSQPFCFRQVLLSTFVFVFLFVDVLFLIHATPISGFVVGLFSISISLIPIIYFFSAHAKRLDDLLVNGNESMHCTIVIILLFLSPELIVLLPWKHSQESYLHVGYFSREQMVVCISCSLLRRLLSISANLVVTLTTIGRVAIALNFLKFMFDFATVGIALARHTLHKHDIYLPVTREVFVYRRRGCLSTLIWFLAHIPQLLDNITEPIIKLWRLTWRPYRNHEVKQEVRSMILHIVGMC